MKDKFDSSNNYILNEYLGNKYERYKAIYFDNNVKKIIADFENNLSLKHIDNTMNIFKSNSIFLLIRINAKAVLTLVYKNAHYTF